MIVLHTMANTRILDREVLDVLRGHAVNGLCRLTLAEIAQMVGCHRNTAYWSARRLAAAGHIRKLSRTGRRGMIYQICQPMPKS